MNDVRQLTSRQACEFLAGFLHVPERLFCRYFDEIELERPAGDATNWSMPVVEARLLYACARATRPENVLELGTHLGYSTRHLADALNMNGSGRVITLDRVQQVNGVPRLAPSYRVIPLEVDGVEFSRQLGFSIDMVFDDGDHTAGATREFLTNCLSTLTIGGLVVVHDVCYPGLAEQVSTGMEEALGDGIERLFVDDGPCGLGFWVNRTRARAASK